MHYWPNKKLDNVKGIVNFKRPEHYEQSMAYADSDRNTFGDRRRLSTKAT